MTRLTHKATDCISDDAKRLLVAGFRAKLPYRAITKQLQEIGVAISERTIARRAAEWRAEQARRAAAREQVENLVAAMREHNMNAAEMLQALAVDALLANPEAWSGADPLAVQRQNLLAQQIRIKERELAIRERAIAVDEKRLALLEEERERAKREAAELAARAERGERLTPEDLRRIKDIYGLD